MDNKGIGVEPKNLLNAICSLLDEHLDRVVAGIAEERGRQIDYRIERADDEFAYVVVGDSQPIVIHVTLMGE